MQLRWLLALLPLAVSSCIFVVSTGPTNIADATIVFVAVDAHGGLVASLRVEVTDAASRWSMRGHTGRDGSFRCDVRSGVSHVRVAVAPPPGYALARQQDWPREFDLGPGEIVELRVHLRASSI